MYKIGFQNFRRFAYFQPIEYKGITFLVGRNNSGKSTLVKALLLIYDFLKSDNVDSFAFGSNSIEDANIVTYGRAKNKKGTEDEDFISFYYVVDGYAISIKITGLDEKIKADVLEFTISDIENGFDFILTPPTITFQSLGEKVEVVDTQNQELLNAQLELENSLKQQLKQITEKSSIEYISINSDLNTLKSRIKDLRKIVRQEGIAPGSFSLETDITKSNIRDIFQDVVFEFSAEYEMQYHDIQGGKKPKKIFESYKAFKDNKFKIEKSIEGLLKLINETNIVYLGATLNKQSALFAIRDKSNPLAQAIHEYKQLGIDLDVGGLAQRFVKKWMSQEEGFEIGNDFEIEMHAGEAYEVIINDNGVKTHLADKGMGSIQAMLLILRLASIIYKKAKDKQDYTIVIEEPELNLHPALQSKLAELFHEVYKDYGIKMIVETHSEYLIRKTQLIVKNYEYEVFPNKNPFAVLYFDKDFRQWNMNYREDGKFIDEFGTGFFDETRKTVKQLM